MSKLNFLLKLQKVQKSLLFFLMVFLPLLVFIQVLLRYVFNAPLMGIEELMLFPTIWLYMLGGASASMERSHITCGIVTLYIKREKSMLVFNIIKTCISTMISVWLTYWAYQYFSYSFMVWKYSNLLHIPMFFGESALFIGLLLMSFFTFLEFIEYIKEFNRYNRGLSNEGVNKIC